MKRKMIQALLGFTAGTMVMLAPAASAMAEETSSIVSEVRGEENVTDDAAAAIPEGTETVVDTTEASAETTGTGEITVSDDSTTVEASAGENTAESSEAESSEGTDEKKDEERKEDPSDFQENSALLTDFNYEAGKMTDDGWESKMLDMAFKPADKMKMSKEDKELLDKYYERNGKEKQVAANEMVAVNESDGYVQVMVEVNPNAEEEEDILDRFIETEGIDLASKTREVKIAGKNFFTRTGVVDKEKYLIGVSTDVDDFVVAIKVKYTSSAERRAFLGAFSQPSEKDKKDDEAETSSETVVTSEEVDDGQANTLESGTDSSVVSAADENNGAETTGENVFFSSTDEASTDSADTQSTEVSSDELTQTDPVTSSSVDFPIN